MNQGRNEEAIVVLSNARNLPPDSDLVQIEFKYVGFFLYCPENTQGDLREIQAQYLFDKETSEALFPDYQDGTFMSNLKLGFHGYASLVTNRGKLHLVL